MKASRITTIIAAVVLAAAVAIYLGTLRADTIEVYRPAADIGAFQRIDYQNDLKKIKVLKDSEELRANEITFAHLEKQIKKHDGYIFFDYNVKAGERVDRRHLRGQKLGTLSVVVAPDERVVAVSTSVLGSVAGLANEGDVVSIVGGDGAKLAEFAKVIARGVGAEAANGVSTVKTQSSGGEGEGSSNSSGNLTFLLAVATDEAEALANSNQGVVMVYNPFCKVQADGSIRPIDAPNAASACPQTAVTAGSDDDADADAADADTDAASTDEETDSTNGDEG